MTHEISTLHSRRTPGSTLPLRPGYENIPLYAPGTSPCAIDMSDTVSLWGAPNEALDALRDAATVRHVSHYPALYNGELKVPLARYARVREDHIVTGCGSDDVLDCAIRAFAQPNGIVAHAAPTFSMVPVYARANGLTPVGIPLTGDDYAVDADALIATNACIIYLCSPNNPTATPVARDAVLRVVERARGLVILDEAYAEFILADDATRAEVFTAEAPGWERVVVLRTMSKAFGLAGLRVGYGVGSPTVIREIEKARGPFKVTYPAEKAALAALGAGLPWVRERAREAVVQREKLQARLRSLGLSPAPSVANFTFVPVPDVAQVASRLRERGVGVRTFRALPTVVPALAASNGDALRLAAGPDAMQQALLDALREIL